MRYSLTHFDYLGRSLFVKDFFNNLIKIKESLFMHRVSGLFFSSLKKEGVEA